MNLRAIFERIKSILIDIEVNGLVWKEGKDIQHLETRKKKGHVPIDFTLEEYEGIIKDILKQMDNETYLYYVKGYFQNYFVIGSRDSHWIVIFSENGIMETAFIIDNYEYDKYFSPEKGYTFLGTLREVLK